MRYLFVFLSILIIWVAGLVIASIVPAANGTILFFALQSLTLVLFYMGFYRR